jgi:hypothetical protein
MQIKRNVNNIQQNLASGTIAFILILVITVAIVFPLSSSQVKTINNSSSNSNIQIETFQADSKPYGLTYGEWTAKWWQ